mmetsp:Transcript_47893/g.129198  ORF Transcript_47893/g.129198 Transcript_47893/m.129198 type:complete len:223 (-) Transcript_47893:179-847(-)
MLHEHVEIRHAAVRMPANNLQLNLTESNPLWNLGPIPRRAVMITSGLFTICPISGHVQGLEVDFGALLTQSARIGLHAKQYFFIALSTRDVYQNVLALLHQVEAFTVNVLQVWIANGGSPGACTARWSWRCRRSPSSERDGDPRWAPVRARVPVLDVALANARGEARSSKCGRCSTWVATQDHLYTGVAVGSDAKICLATAIAVPLNPAVDARGIRWPRARP